MGRLTVSSSPHITKKGHTTRRIMIDVLIALSPAVIAAILYFGLQVLFNVLACVAACMLTEMLYTMLKNKQFNMEGLKKSTVWDLSAAVTGVILALNLPSFMRVDKWDFNLYSKKVRNFEFMTFSGDALLICIIGGIFAILLVKLLFGGLGRNFANPAATSRIFLFACFAFAAVNTVGTVFTASTGATWLSLPNKPTSANNLILNYFIGNRGAAAVGETSIAAILLGYIYLSVRKVIDFRLPLIIIGTAAVFAFLFDSVNMSTGARTVNNLIMHVLSGGLIFGAVFMATDYSSSPNTFLGKAIFGFGIGFLAILIRMYATYPEGMSFAIVLMNVLTPLIDKYIVPKPFGYVKPVKKKLKSGKSKTEVKG